MFLDPAIRQFRRDRSIHQIILFAAFVISTVLALRKLRYFRRTGPVMFQVVIRSSFSSPAPLILAWNHFFKWSFSEMNLFRGCPISDCPITMDRRYLAEARLIILRCWNSYDVIPQKRPAWQIWAIFCLECPNSAPPFRNFSLLNRTYTYRTDSDFFASYASPIPMSLPPHGRKVKGALIMFLASNCHSFSGRECFVRELMRFVRVDSYGKCLHNSDALDVDGMKKQPSRLNAELLTFVGYYKFYLAYENSICRSYRTEKLFRAFRAGSVPIVSGIIEDEFLPYRPSVISADNFSTVKALADYLIWLDSNPLKYEDFLRWRVIPPDRLLTAYLGLEVKRCSLCAQLHSSRWQPATRTLKNISEWWSGDGVCRPPLIKLNACSIRAPPLSRR
jgi:hypothetical protein